MAPGASLVSLKVLDQDGEGTVGHILKALDWVYKNGKDYGVRVVNLSVGAAVTESYYTDPLTLATKTLVDSGITVVAAAGNNGKNGNGQAQWGGIVSPANAPWVLTVCAFSTNGTYDVADDKVADFSSSGPTADRLLGEAGSLRAWRRRRLDGWRRRAACSSRDCSALPSWLLPGTVPTLYPVPAVRKPDRHEHGNPAGQRGDCADAAGEPEPDAEPDQGDPRVHGDLETRCQPAAPGRRLHERVARRRAGRPGGAVDDTQRTCTMPSTWAQHILWGNHMLQGGVINPKANAWRLGVEWGWAKTNAIDGDNIVWGTAADGDNIVWGTMSDGDNIVWGTMSDGDNIVWGTAADGDNIVWGTDCGGDDCDNVVWGTQDGDNIVWGTAADGDNIVWGTMSDGDNIVWGTAADGDNIVWGTANVTNTVWPIFKGGM